MRGAVVVDDILRILKENADLARRAVAAVARALPGQRSCACASALENAIITSPAEISAEARERLDVIAGHYMKGNQ